MQIGSLLPPDWGRLRRREGGLLSATGRCRDFPASTIGFASLYSLSILHARQSQCPEVVERRGEVKREQHARQNERGEDGRIIL